MTCASPVFEPVSETANILHDFIIENRTEIIERCRAKFATRAAPRVTDLELEQGVPLFLDQFVEIVRAASGASLAMTTTASKLGGALLHKGFTIAQVVHDYGGICQAITELAVETEAPIGVMDFKTLNLCLDDSIAEAVTEYARLRAMEGTERAGRLAHELNGLLHTMSLAFDMLKSGEVGVGGSTSKVIDGMGLGLAICRRGARSHGGDIHVRNQPGVGCVFTLDLPRLHTVAETPGSTG